ncbi:uncharacterized protein LOC125674936 [Ostrea edulis]|uniref:uncharacterized protein LOC125674936 n=1 Tax=Ostrea edulis TaxID=37623 RepID=UPI0024AF1D64|nr:uncharacterized protein LOC125674936 [Ostrea edulis]
MDKKFNNGKDKDKENNSKDSKDLISELTQKLLEQIYKNIEPLLLKGNKNISFRDASMVLGKEKDKPMYFEDVDVNLSKRKHEFLNLNFENKDYLRLRELATQLPVDIVDFGEIAAYNRKVFHTIICIDTSASMKDIVPACRRIIRQYLQEISDGDNYDEIISVIAFGKRVLHYIYKVETPNGHTEFIENILNSHDSWKGCTPLSYALRKCKEINDELKVELRRRSRDIRRCRILMMTDGKPTSNNQQEHINDDQMQQRSEETMLEAMCGITHGKVFLSDDIFTFARISEIEMFVDTIYRDCQRYNWHEVFAYVRLKRSGKDMLYYELATQLIASGNRAMNFDFAKAALPRFLQRYPERAIFAWLRKRETEEWEYLPNEVNRLVRNGLRNLENYRITILTIPYQDKVLRFDFEEGVYCEVNSSNRLEFKIRRKFMGNDWG